MGFSPKVSQSLFYNTYRVCLPCEMALTPLTIDVCSEVDFTDIIISDDSFITSVWSIMSCTVIQRTSSRKSWSGFQTILSYQLTGDTLQRLTEIDMVIILLFRFQAIKYRVRCHKFTQNCNLLVSSQGEHYTIYISGPHGELQFVYQHHN